MHEPLLVRFKSCEIQFYCFEQRQQQQHCTKSASCTTYFSSTKQHLLFDDKSPLKVGGLYHSRLSSILHHLLALSTHPNTTRRTLFRPHQTTRSLTCNGTHFQPSLKLTTEQANIRLWLPLLLLAASSFKTTTSSLINIVL